MQATIADRALNQRRILIVEDEYLLADELALELADEGATVLGPVPSVEEALALLEQQASPDGAILDVDLRGEPVFPLADALVDRGVPLIFTTGYDPETLPERFAGFPKCEKPTNARRISAVLSKAIHA